MASDPSDWDPLPELDTALHPGEEAVAWAPQRNAPARPTAPAPGAGSAQPMPAWVAAMQPGATAPKAPQSGPPPSTSAPSRAPTIPAQPPTWRDERAAALLQGMQQRLASTPPSHSLVAVMRGSERRGQKVAAAAATARPVRSHVHAEEPLPAEIGEDRDARQDEPWFRALPVVEQERLSRVWDQEKQRFRGLPSRRRQELLEWFWVAYVVFFLAAMPLMLVEGLAGFVRMAMAGCVTGLVWQALPRDRFWCVSSALLVYALVVVVPRMHELIASPFDAAVALGSGCLVAYLAALGAMHDEMQRNGMLKA